MGVARDYDQIGLKPDQREIKSPPITHQIAVVEEQNNNSSPMLKMSCVQISELIEPDTCLRDDTPGPSNLESGVGPGKSFNTTEPELISSEVLQTPDSKLGQGSDSKPPTHHKQYSPCDSGSPDICDHVRTTAVPRNNPSLLGQIPSCQRQY